jgi:hypothetical protein
MPFDFKRDLQEYQGQETEPGVLAPEGSQIKTPSFQEDLSAYQMDEGPTEGKADAARSALNTQSAVRAEMDSLIASLPDPTDAYATHVANSPDELLPTSNIEIDYANRDLAREDLQSIPTGTVGGQCGVYAENVVKLEGGGNWIVGDTIQQKANSVERYRKGGLAFKPGEDTPKPGQTIIQNPGTKWGHVAVINDIDEDGYATLTESNWNNDRRVTHNRRIKLDDPSIVGFIRTE